MFILFRGFSTSFPQEWHSQKVHEQSLEYIYCRCAKSLMYSIVFTKIYYSNSTSSVSDMRKLNCPSNFANSEVVVRPSPECFSARRSAGGGKQSACQQPQVVWIITARTCPGTGRWVGLPWRVAPLLISLPGDWPPPLDSPIWPHSNPPRRRRVGGRPLPEEEGARNWIFFSSNATRLHFNDNWILKSFGCWKRGFPQPPWEWCPKKNTTHVQCPPSLKSPLPRDPLEFRALHPKCPQTTHSPARTK